MRPRLFVCFLLSAHLQNAFTICSLVALAAASSDLRALVVVSKIQDERNNSNHAASIKCFSAQNNPDCCVADLAPERLAMQNSVMPHEFVAGSGRGMLIIGRVVSKQHRKVNENLFTELHLLCDVGFKGLLYVEAWRDHARRLNDGAPSETAVAMQDLTIKSLGDRSRFQSSALEVYAQFQQHSTVTTRNVIVPRALPTHLPHVQFSSLPTFAGKKHQVSVVGRLGDLEDPRNTGEGRMVQTVWIVFGSARVKISAWPESQAKFRTAGRGSCVFATRLTCTLGPNGKAELSTGKSTELLEPPEALREEALAATPDVDSAAIQSISHVYQRQDFARASARQALLSSVTGTVVPGAVRDLDGLFLIHHAILISMEPLGSNDHAYYNGCLVCKKKVELGSRCQQHGDKEPGPCWLASLTIGDFTTTAVAKAIGDVVESIVKLPPGQAVPNAEGQTPFLDLALNTARATPLNFKIRVTKNQDVSKNVLEIVHAEPAFNAANATATIPTQPLAAIRPEQPGLPPISIDGLEEVDGCAKVGNVFPQTIQILVHIADTGMEPGVLAQDGAMVRISRNATCVLSGAPMVLQRTGRVDLMQQYMRFNKKDILFAVVRPLAVQRRANADGPAVWHAFLLGHLLMAEEAFAAKFHTYYQQYVDYYRSCLAVDHLHVEKAFTPKRRKKMVEDSASVDTPLQHTPLASTPLRHTPP